MKYHLVNSEIKAPYVENLLKERGIKNVSEYINPTINYLNDPIKLDNIEEGAELYLNTITHNGNILIVVDSDCDGFTSAAIIYQYTKKIKPDANIFYLLHEGKQHGLQDHIDSLLEKDEVYDLIILPDSSSNDYKYHEQLRDINVPVLVLDHHITDTEISNNAIIINNQLSNNYPNKDLTGAGVTYQFCRYVDNISNTNYADYFLDLAALGIIGDMGNVLEIENRYIIKKGLETINNFFFQTLINKQSYSMNNEINPITVAFYIVPLINAMIRVGTIEEKKRLFEAFINGTKKVLSNKRGAKGTEELLAIESTRECINAKTRQNNIKEKVVNSLEIKIHKYDLLSNKILFIRLDDDDDFPPELNGLVAMQLSSKYNKPTIVARLNEEGFIRGSARGLNDSELKSFKNFLDDTKMFEYTAGHDNAFGISIYNSYLSNFHNYANKILRDINFGENIYDVNFIKNASDKELFDLIIDLSKHKDLWGQGNPEALIYIDNINLIQDDIQIIGKNKDTVKFEKFGIVYIQFHAKELINKLKEYNNISIKIIGRANLNTWMGKETPQIIIDDYEIHDGTYSF